MTTIIGHGLGVLSLYAVVLLIWYAPLLAERPDRATRQQIEHDVANVFAKSRKANMC